MYKSNNNQLSDGRVALTAASVAHGAVALIARHESDTSNTRRAGTNKATAKSCHFDALGLGVHA